VTDGVFSMDGDIAPLPAIIDLARRYGAMLMVDDAHATGSLGLHGGGTLDYFGLKHCPDIIMGTFSKALGGVGGFIGGSRELIRFLRIAAKPCIFSSALPPGTVAGVIAAIRQIKSDTTMRERLWKNAGLLRNGLKARGFEMLGETHMVPVLVGREEIGIRASDALFESGVFVPCARWPAVPEGQSRLRCTVMATHTEAQINWALSVFEDVGRSLGIA
jgi:8-amino-7-oxononanoate synthase